MNPQIGDDTVIRAKVADGRIETESLWSIQYS